VRELRLVVETVDLAAILGNGSERDNIVEIESQCRVYVVNKRLHILFGASVEGNDSESETAATETLENALVVFNGGTAVARGVVTTTWAPPDKRPLRISTPMEPFPTPVIRAFLSLNVVPDVAISCRTSKYTPVRLELYSHWVPIRRLR
jgi:hypothetical protein